MYRCGGMFHDQFVRQSLYTESAGQRMLKVGQYFSEVMCTSRVSCFLIHEVVALSKLWSVSTHGYVCIVSPRQSKSWQRRCFSMLTFCRTWYLKPIGDYDEDTFKKSPKLQGRLVYCMLRLVSCMHVTVCPMYCGLGLLVSGITTPTATNIVTGNLLLTWLLSSIWWLPYYTCLMFLCTLSIYFYILMFCIEVLFVVYVYRLLQPCCCISDKCISHWQA